jgi:hypothetical protein
MGFLKENTVPGLYCPRCGKKGFTVQVHEGIMTPRGKLDFPHYRCGKCLQMWYEQADVLAYVFATSGQQAPIAGPEVALKKTA